MAQHFLAQLYAEHGSLAAVLNAMSTLLREVREHGRRIDPKVFRAMLYYLDVFLEREHHRKEELVLFPRIRARTRAADAVLGVLAREHEMGERAIRGLEQAFLRYEERGQAEFASFAAAADTYVARYLEHIRKEEREVMPLALRVLTAEDREAIEEEFASHHDPLAGANEQTDPNELFQRIVMIVPAPYGVGAPLDD
jgi:hemerythrin-like domain-containing protein